MRGGKPVIGIACCARSIAFGDYDPLTHHTVFGKYVDFVADHLECVPILIPALERPKPGFHAAIVEKIDGLLLPGSPSNVGHRFVNGEDMPVQIVGSRDDARDQTNLPLLRLCIERRVPVLGLCRGMQEINVALGGDLHQEVHTLNGYADHRSDKTRPWFDRYEQRHKLRVEPGGLLHEILDSSDEELTVNTLHGQAVSVAGQGVHIDARSEDGVIEAISCRSAGAFVLGVQWHLEWLKASGDLDQKIARAFSEACGIHHSERWGS